MKGAKTTKQKVGGAAKTEKSKPDKQVEADTRLLD